MQSLLGVSLRDGARFGGTGLASVTSMSSSYDANQPLIRDNHNASNDAADKH
jgi:hypothetical protein